MVVGVFSAMGVAFLLEPKWLLPLTTVFLIPALVVLGRDAGRNRFWKPFWLGVVSATGILAGKFLLESNAVMFGGMVLLVCASIWSVLPIVRRGGENMAAKRVFEVFSAGCVVCNEVIAEIREQACESCEVRILDMSEAEVAERARSLGIRTVPAVVVDGRLADCCSARGVDLDVLKGLGLGQP
ncbi:MAG: glutaredoxin domain-containing protein [Planctomycetota bacterium]